MNPVFKEDRESTGVDSPDPVPKSPGGVTTERPPRLGVWAVAIVLLLIAGWFFGYLPRAKGRTTLDGETHELAATTVAVVNPRRGDQNQVFSLPAEIKPFIESPILARASGYLKRWLVDLGSEVKEGQLLAEIDTPELNQELDKTRAELNQAAASLELAKTTAMRWAELLKTSSVSEQESAEKQSDLKLKAANLEAAQANLRRLEDLRSFANVTAPYAGTITARKVDVGDLITAGGTKELFRLAQLKTLRVYVRVPQTVSRFVKLGQTAEVIVPEVLGRVFPAKVVRTAGLLDATTRTLLVELEVENPRGEITAGSFAQIRLTEASGQQPLTVPATTLQFHAEGVQVGLVKVDNTVELRIITIGRDYGQVIEVLDGLTETDRVINNPPDSLVEGARIRVIEPKAETKPAK